MESIFIYNTSLYPVEGHSNAKPDKPHLKGLSNIRNLIVIVFESLVIVFDNDRKPIIKQHKQQWCLVVVLFCVFFFLLSAAAE